MKIEWPDRQKLYRIIDSESENFFVPANSFSEAEAKFLKWDAGVDAEYREDAIQSIIDTGYLINETVPRDSFEEGSNEPTKQKAEPAA